MASAPPILYNASDWTVLDSFDTTLTTSNERILMSHTLASKAEFDVKYIKACSKTIDLTNHNTLFLDIEFVVKDSEGRVFTDTEISSVYFDIMVDFSSQYSIGGTMSFYQAQLSTIRYFDVSSVQSTTITITTYLDPAFSANLGDNYAEYIYFDFYLKLTVV